MVQQYYHFHSWFHHIHQHNCKCDRLLCQCKLRHFGKDLRNIRQYLKIVLEYRWQKCDFYTIFRSRCPKIFVDIYHKLERIR